MTNQTATRLAFLMVKSSAYSAGQVSAMMDEGGVEDSLKTLGTLGGGVLGGAAGLASAIRHPQGGAPDYAQAMIGAGVGAGLGNLASRLAVHGMRGYNKRMGVAESVTGIPRSKLEELPTLSKVRLLHHADSELQARRRKEKYGAEKRGPSDRQRIQKILGHRQSPGLRALVGAGVGGALGAGYGALRLRDDPAIGAAIGGVGLAAGGGLAGYFGARRHNKLVDMPREERQKLIDAAVTLNALTAKHASSVYQGPRDFSATQLREYQLKHLEPGMGRVIDAVGATGGALLGGAAGQQLGDHPILGAVGGSIGGMMLARAARHQASNAIAKHYVTRRVMEEASGAPISSQIRGLRTRSAPVVRGVEGLITGAPKGAPLKLVSKPVVEGMP